MYTSVGYISSCVLIYIYIYVCVCVCLRVSVRAWVGACARVCVCRMEKFNSA
jgi:hypothetical protein